MAIAWRALRADNNEVINGSSRANKTEKISAKSKNIKKFSKAKMSEKTRCFKAIYLLSSKSSNVLFIKNEFNQLFLAIIEAQFKN